MDTQQDITIELRAYDHKLLDIACKEIVRSVKRTGAELIGPIPFPINQRVYTVVKGPHIHKLGREQFKLTIFKRLMKIKKSTPQTMSALDKIEIPTGVDIKVKL